MIDPPDTDGEVPQQFLDLIDEILADSSSGTLPVSLDRQRARHGASRRVVAYGAVAAAVVLLALLGVAALHESNNPSVDAERAAIPTLPATSNSSSEVAGNMDQLEADAEIAAGLGLTIGPQVFRDDGSFVLADQPDLTPVYEGDALVGYSLSGAADLDYPEEGFVVYGPDGVSVRGEFDLRAGFVPSTDPSSEPGD